MPTHRTSGGAEIDLLVIRPGQKPPLAFEIKFSSAPTVSKGLHSGKQDLGLKEAYVVCPCREAYPMGNGILTLPVKALPELVARAG
ncbi:MAG: hypothetical protein WC655_05165 [Candidatus Hydrogenedentales bacterium]